MTRTIVPIIVNCTSCTDSRIDWVRSKNTSKLMDWGICVRRPGKNILDSIDDFDDVGAGLPLDSQDDGPFIVEPAADSGVFDAIDRRADVLNAHRRAIAIGDDHRPISFRIGELGV